MQFIRRRQKVKYCLLLRTRCEEKSEENAYRILMGSLSERFNCSDVTRQPNKEFFNHSPGTRNNKIISSLRSLHCDCFMASSKATSSESAI